MSSTVRVMPATAEDDGWAPDESDIPPPDNHDAAPAEPDEEWFAPSIEALEEPPQEAEDDDKRPPIRRRLVLAGCEVDVRAVHAPDATNLAPAIDALDLHRAPRTPAGSQSSWARHSLGGVGVIAALEPTYLVRDDGVALLYPGRVHDFHGEPESMKSLAAQLAVVSVLNAGERALYVDLEGQAEDLSRNLIAMGATRAAVEELLVYVRPEEPFNGEAFASVLAEGPFSIGVIDGVDAALSAEGLNPNVGHDYHVWRGRVVRIVQAACVGPVILVDHVVKNRETRGDWAAGTFAKRAAIDGAAFGFEKVQDFGRGRVGIVRLLLHKDRVGALRGIQGPGKEIARLRLTSHDDGHITHELLPPAAPAEGDDSGQNRWRPTGLMERVSNLVEKAREPLSKNNIETTVAGKRDYVRLALSALVEEGYVEAVTGPKNAIVHRSLKPFRENVQ
jgi:hypothetical protein